MGRNILLTGAAGFIGSHTAERLLKRGDSVVGIDNFNDYYDPSLKRATARELTAHAAFHLVEGDIRDVSLVNQLFSRHRFDTVIHLAAMAGVRSSVDNPSLYLDVNLNGTMNLLEATRLGGRPHFVFASTSSAYGRTERIPFVETDHCDRPLAPYPATKRSAELLGHCYHHMHGVDFTALRFFTVYGPRNRPDMLAYLALEACEKGTPLTLYNQGNMHRDWTYVADIADGVVKAADRRLGYQIINLGRGEPVLLSDFVRKIGAAFGKQPPIASRPMPTADVEVTFANIDKARRLLDYCPKTSVDDGVRSLYRWYKERSH